MAKKPNIVERLKAELLTELRLRTPADLRAFWEQAKWPKPNLVKLAKSKSSPLACALNRLEPDVLALTSAKLDPFGCLLDMVDVTAWSKFCDAIHAPWMSRIWLATASQLRAQSRLVHKAHGWGKTWEELRRSRNKADVLHRADAHFLAELAHANEKRRAELLALSGLQERLRKAREGRDEAYLTRFRRAHKGRRRGADVAKAEVFVVQNWLELPRRLPGLCFFSDSAIHALLEACGLSTGDDSAAKQLRVRLGLIQAGTNRHLIEEVADLTQKLIFTGRMMTKSWTLKGEWNWNKRQLWPR